MFSIKEVANGLNITTQAIYKKKDLLQSKGYLIKNNQGQLQITDEGYNYLRDTQGSYIIQHDKEEEKKTHLNTLQTKQTIEETKEPQNTYLTMYIDSLKDKITTQANQVTNLTKQLENLQANYNALQSNYNDLAKTNIELQTNLNNYFANHSLNGEVDPNYKNDNDKNKSSFWYRLFGRK